MLLILYKSIICAHFNYGHLVWGSKTNTDHPLHSLQKRTLKIVANQDYIAHSESICKSLGLLRVPDMFKFALWKLYYNLITNKLPTFENLILDQCYQEYVIFIVLEGLIYINHLWHAFANNCFVASSQKY